MTAAVPGGQVELDHVSFAVHDALGWARRLRRELGATPIAGLVLEEFRYLLLHVGTADEGGRLELLEPAGPGFLQRYLSRRGEGPHHLTFTVPDLPAAVTGARALGATVTGESYGHPPWQEAFVAPDGRHGVVVQLSSSDRAYPRADDLLATRHRDPDRMPATRGGVDPLWWTGLWDTPAAGSARLGATLLGSTDPAFSRDLFEGVLGARVNQGEGFVEYAWPGGSLEVRPADRPGITGARLRGAGGAELRIGAARLAAGSSRRARSPRTALRTCGPTPGPAPTAR